MSGVLTTFQFPTPKFRRLRQVYLLLLELECNFNIATHTLTPHI